MDYYKILYAVSVVVLGSLLLRVAGRKSLAQTTAAETVVMISIGSLLVQPLAEKSLLLTFGAAIIMVLTTRFLGYLQVRSNGLENVFTGKALVIIEKGTLNIANLSKVGLTVDQLEMQLRQSSVMNISDVEWGTIEANGRLGFILKEGLQPVTKEDFQKFVNTLNQTLASMNIKQQTIVQPKKNPLQKLADKSNIFSEVSEKSSSIPRNQFH